MWNKSAGGIAPQVQRRDSLTKIFFMLPQWDAGSGKHLFKEGRYESQPAHKAVIKAVKQKGLQ